jgi:hypothetical protein
MAGSGKALRIFALSLLLAIPPLLSAGPALADAADQALNIIARYVPVLATERSQKDEDGQTTLLRTAAVGKGGELPGAQYYVDQVAKDYETAAARVAFEQQVREAYWKALVALFMKPETDDSLSIKGKILETAACNLQMVGTRRWGPDGCAVEADPRYEGADFSPGRAILDRYTIPFDLKRFNDLATQLANATTAKPFTLDKDDALHYAIDALIFLYHRANMEQESWPQGATMKTSGGVGDALLLTGSLNRRYSSMQALLNVLSYHAAPSKAMVSDCITKDMNAQRNALMCAANAAPEITPPDGFCPSHITMDIGFTCRDWQAVEQLKASAPSGILQAIFASRIGDNIDQRRLVYTSMVNMASAAAAGDNEGGTVNKSNIRPVSDPNGNPPPAATPPSSEGVPISDAAPGNKELLSAIRELTKAIQRRRPGAFEGRVEEVRDQGSGTRDQGSKFPNAEPAAPEPAKLVPVKTQALEKRAQQEAE